jgi:hypothetical protein
MCMLGLPCHRTREHPRKTDAAPTASSRPCAQHATAATTSTAGRGWRNCSIFGARAVAKDGPSRNLALERLVPLRPVPKAAAGALAKKSCREAG